MEVWKLSGLGLTHSFFWLFLKNICLFIWLYQVLVYGMQHLSCGMWDLVP